MRKNSRLEQNSSDWKVRLASYSATAGAALLIMAPATSEAEGVRLITSANLNWNTFPVGPTNPPILTIPDTGIGRVTFDGGIVGYFQGNKGGVNSNNASLQGAGAVALFASAHGALINFNAGEALGGATTTAGALGRLVTSGNGGNVYLGHFTPGHPTGYVGFNLGGPGSLGWLRVRVTWDAGNPTTISLVPKVGTTDIYGAFGPSDIIPTAGAVPEPSTTALTGLGLLAIGAAGIRELRRRRAHAGRP